MRNSWARYLRVAASRPSRLLRCVRLPDNDVSNSFRTTEATESRITSPAWQDMMSSSSCASLRRTRGSHTPGPLRAGAHTHTHTQVWSLHTISQQTPQEEDNTNTLPLHTHIARPNIETWGTLATGYRRTCWGYTPVCCLAMMPLDPRPW